MSSGHPLPLSPKSGVTPTLASSLHAINSPGAAPTAVPVPALGARDEETLERQKLLGKVAHMLQKTMSRSRDEKTDDTNTNLAPESAAAASPASTNTSLDRVRSATPWSESSAANRVKETSHVSLEYDPTSRRKVLNTYEILREIGRGEHGKVKLAKNLVNNELVAIKIVSRKSKDRSLRMRRPSNLAPSQQYISSYEAKIKREIAIMKRCDHKHIVRFKEVLDDRNSYKIYLVLEYMDRGEIKWKRQSPITSPRPLDHVSSDKIPCWSGNRRPSAASGVSHASGLAAVATEDNDLLSNEFSPNLTFRQSRRIFRDVLLGLEYLHMQGIVHRDIKPANLLVSSDYTVKISDFGVSFASSLGSTDDGIYFSEMELAKTVGTPAFYAPELCQTTIDASLSEMSASAESQFSGPLSPRLLPGGKDGTALPRVDHKIDIWAMGVTLYCLLFGRVPFNADSEFALFDVIVNEELTFPDSPSSFFSPQEVTQEEFDLAKDLLRKMLEKNSRKRIDLEDIKRHEFVLLDLHNDPERLNEFYFLNSQYSLFPSGLDIDSTRSQNNSPAVGFAKRVGGSLLKAFNNDSTASVGINRASVAADSHAEISRPFNLRAQKSPEIGTDRSAHAPDHTHKTRPATPAGQSSAQWSAQSTQAYATSPPNQSARRSSLAVGNPLLQDVMDYGTLRRDSVNSQEAPQIETKRNVSGDLYMKNQSAIDAFKDIQKSDKKRRKSSIFASLSRSSSISAGKPTKSADEMSPPTQFAAPIPISLGIDTNLDSEVASSSKIKVGPISIDSNRRPSSVISLPLTESFASLDSFNDAYLSSKYHEFKTKKHAMRLLDDSVTQSDSALGKESNSPHVITEKFKAFNFGKLMTEGRSPEPYGEDDLDGLEPLASRKPFVATKKPFLSLHDSSGSDSYSSSSCSSNSSSDNEEGGNLTLKFNSKVAPRSRPPFLTLSNRAFSHDSNLTDLAHSSKNGYYTPYSFQGQAPELEDVPESLMGDDPISTLPDVNGNHIESQDVPLSQTDFLRSKLGRNNPAQSSPLRSEIVSTPDSSKSEVVMNVALDEHLSRKASEGRNSTITRGYFNNHYKKEHVRSPLPASKHLDADKESESKKKSKGFFSHLRPTYHRSNSITLGLLQHEPSDLES